MVVLHLLGEGHPTKQSFAEILFSTSSSTLATMTPLEFALVGKFTKGWPFMKGLRKDFLAIGFKGPYSLGCLDTQHVLIRFDLEKDYHRC